VTDLRVFPQASPLVGSIGVPADKSIGHRALLLGAISSGRTEIRGLSGAGDHESTLECLRALGVPWTLEPSGRGQSTITFRGVGLFGLQAPTADLDCGNSGTSMRLLAGLLAGQSFAATLVGDASLMTRPMARVVTPLRQRGAQVVGTPDPRRPGDLVAPLRFAGLGERALTELAWDSPKPSAQIKSALLLSGLYAHGTTTLRESVVSRDHTERMFAHLGVPLRAVGGMVELDPSGWNGQISAFSLLVPGDFSAAAFPAAAASIIPGSRIELRHVGLNPTRTGMLEWCRDVGLKWEVEHRGEEAGEPVGNLHASAGTGTGALLAGERLVRSLDEVPIIAALAAACSGTTHISDADELRTKESDRLRSTTLMLRAFGVKCTEEPAGLLIEGIGDGSLAPADVDSFGDHRIAMAATVLALRASGPSVIRNSACIMTSFPRFVATMRGLGARIDVEA
jgi:3-phosphoshikimate 1-carboxyvinyltransferase